MKLHITETGSGDGPPILMAHGLFGQGRNLGGIARRLAETRRVISVDMRNHGDSPADPDHSYPALAADLAAVIVDHGGVADVAGHSMGGKAAMALALTHPQAVRRLAVLDIAPIGYGHTQTRLIDAMEGLDLTGVDRKSEADRRLSETVDEPGVRAFLLQSLDLKSDPPRWRMNLQVLRESMAQLVGWPDDLPWASQFDEPALFLTGALSDYVTDDGRAAIRRLFPQARIVAIKGAGHWLHADAPETVADALAQFFAA